MKVIERLGVNVILAEEDLWKVPAEVHLSIMQEHTCVENYNRSEDPKDSVWYKRSRTAGQHRLSRPKWKCFE